MTEPRRATLKAKGGVPFPVHFNPSSLDYTITNALAGGSETCKAQYVSQSTGKLAMELLFDTTGTGDDVRRHTEKVAALMKPEGQPGQRSCTPAVVVFEWGTYSFEGFIDSYREKIDFFSEGGVPLRASVNLSMTQQKHVFESGTKAGGSGGMPDVGAIEAQLGVDTSAEDIAARAGDPAAAAAIAAANGLESLRLPNVPTVRLDTAVPFAPPPPFAPGSAFTPSDPASARAAAGQDYDIAAREPELGGGPLVGGVDVSASAAARQAGGATSQGAALRSLPAAGRSAATRDPAAIAADRRSVGVPATEGAFAGLRQPAPRGAIRLDPARVLPAPEGDPHGTATEVGYRIGGQVLTLGTGAADVGQTVSLAERIRFDRGDRGRGR